MYNATVFNTKLYNQGPAFSLETADDTSLADASLRSPGKIVASTVGITDNVSLIKLVSVLIEDSLSMIDTLAKAVMHAESDSSVATDSVSKAVARVSGDLVSVTDATIKLPGKVISSLVSVVDNSFRSFIGKTISDSPTITDLLSFANNFYRSFNDSTTIADAVGKTTVLHIASLVAITDSLTRYVQLTLSSSISLIDSIGKRVTKLISESALLIADLTITARAYLVRVADTIGITDAMTGLFNTLRVGPAIV